MRAAPVGATTSTRRFGDGLVTPAAVRVGQRGTRMGPELRSVDWADVLLRMQEALMNQTLLTAIAEVELLPEEDQEELARALLRMATRKRIDAKLAAAELQGGAIAQEEVVARLRARYAG
jgi:hypothetical protein